MTKRKLVAVFIALCLIVQIFVFSACDNQTEPTPPDGGDNPEVPTEPVEKLPDFRYTAYDNCDFTTYDDGDVIECEKLPGQFEGYGIGDPYIFRYNGTYYLYASTRDTNAGVLGWKSSDMLQWTQCTGEGLDTGYVSQDGEYLRNAYAPEVYYFNGKFHMYTSPGGNGHYILTSDSPEGPFVKAAGNFGMSIDGSVFVDDDEKMYFLNASGEGIEIHAMDSLDSVPRSAVTLSNTKLGWTEGAMIIKRNGIYYLTYTGIHCLSPGYRVCYNTELDGNPLADSNAFKGGADNPILLDIDGEYKGLGHSSTVLGPDMDSYYIAYHNLHKPTSIGTWRSLNIDRLLFNGTQMSVDGSPVSSVAANMPAFYSDGVNSGKFTVQGVKSLSKDATSQVFTAEFNYVGDKVKCVISYEDDNNYAYVCADYENHKITLCTVKNGVEKVVEQGTLVHDFLPEVLHTVRVSYADGVCDVYFDNLCKISGANVKLGAGKIGYIGGEAYYTAFSNVARGYSDRLELKQSGAQIGASTYLPENAYENLTSYKLSKGSELSQYSADLEGDACFDGALQLKLLNEGDFARYSLYFRESGRYALTLTYDSQYCGRKIGVQLNLEDVRSVELPEVNADGCNVVRTAIACFDVKKGANLLTFHRLARTYEYISFSFERITQADIIDDLTSASDDAYYSSACSFSSQGLTAPSSGRSVVFFGDGGYSDCEISTEIKLNNSGGLAGVLLRADNFANVAQENQLTAVQGYFVGLSGSNFVLSKYNYNYSQVNIDRLLHGVKPSEWVTLKAVVKGNEITAYLNGDLVFEYVDSRPFVCGYFGFYTADANVTYRNLMIKSI